jgi:hypothetical protein
MLFEFDRIGYSDCDFEDVDNLEALRRVGFFGQFIELVVARSFKD